RPADQLSLPEDGQADEPVVDVRDRPAALVGVGIEDHVALDDRLVEGFEHLRDVGAELPDDHAPARVGDHRELVVLLANHGAHGSPEERRVHLEAGALQRTLDDVERDGVDLDVRDLCDLDSVHRAPPWPLVGSMMRFRYRSTSAVKPVSTTVVESNSVTIAGPSTRLPGTSLERSKILVGSHSPPK